VAVADRSLLMGADSDSVCMGLAGRGDTEAAGACTGDEDRFSLTDKLANNNNNQPD